MNSKIQWVLLLVALILALAMIVVIVIRRASVVNRMSTKTSDESHERLVEFFGRFAISPKRMMNEPRDFDIT